MSDLPTPAPGDSPALIPLAEPPPLTTVITQDGKPVRLRAEGQRTLALVPPGGKRVHPLRFDLYQAEAMHQALGDALAAMRGGYVFERGQNRGEAGR